MKCPYCNTAAHMPWRKNTFEDESSPWGGFSIDHAFCPECGKLIVRLCHSDICRQESLEEFELGYVDREEVIYPKAVAGKILNDIIPKQYIDLYRESEQVNDISPRASATLSRYLLQMLLHEELRISKRNLEEELKELEEVPNVPSELVTMLQVMRRVSNFGAHPKKSTHSNEIVEVEMGESEVILELLAELFDYIFVKPNQQKEFLKKVEEKYGIKP